MTPVKPPVPDSARHHHESRTVADHALAVATLLERGTWADREPEWVELDQAVGRILARDVAAQMDLPPFTNSQMDGYAVRAAETASTGTVVELTVTAPVAAGHMPPPLMDGQAAPVMTGAPIPAGADVVVPIEVVDPPHFRAEGSTVRIPAPQEAGRFIRPAGDDVASGTTVVTTGTRLTPLALGACAAAGLTHVQVRPRLRINLLTTGDEVVPPGQHRGPAQIFDSNAQILRACLDDPCLQVTGHFHVPDHDDALRHLLAAQASGGDAEAPDLWISSGGISEGAFEVVRRVLNDPEVAEFSEFLHIAMQPGGPQGLARVNGTPFLCFPGNPISTWISAEMFLRPALVRWGASSWSPEMQVPCGQQLHPLPGKLRVVRGYWDGSAVRRVGGYGSHLLAGAVTANALILLEPGEDPLPAGSPVRVWLVS
ncbi:molybdopterin molybdotransferase MoeA [Kocuria sp.]|uniref:molybdopterin molybdotransferase MoeA n=1 Tax=Kocuria sp. TaxID=1871328 RepID=UPI0026DEB5C6|nr:gephyrin-like molybdotransferase Glp [Kocuria sp.]MDO5617835.1 molybdopterin molybdotransferase MoeA [Kocuria sp.]